MGPDTAPMRTVWGPMHISYGVYVVRHRSQTECIVPDEDPMRNVSDLIHIAYGVYVV